ncbi:MAG: amidohydrolase family protein [Firmicutes bacterium]|nr:amidohydrolase family protein [Bacillota bacterium]
MSNNDKALIIQPGWLWDGVSGRASEDLAVLIRGGRFEKLGSPGELRAAAPGAELLKDDRWLLMPAFTDAHDHGRGITPSSMMVPDQALEVWLQDLNKLAPIPHFDACLFDALRMAACGVGTVLHSHNPNSFSAMKDELAAAARGYAAGGLRSILCPLFIDQNKKIYYGRDEFLASLPEPLRSSFGGSIRDRIMTIDEYFELIEATAEELKDEIAAGWTEIQLHPNGGQWCSDESLIAMKEYAMKRGMHIHLHLLETKYQAEYARRTWGKSFIEHYAEIGFLGPWVSFGHAVWLTERDFGLIKESGAVLVNNASSNLRLRSGSFDLRTAARLDVTAGIGMDGCTIDDDQDFLREMRVVWLNDRESGVDASVDPLFVLRMATSKGAKISAGELSPGVIAPGRNADLVCLNMEKVAFPYADPDVDPLALTVQRASRGCADLTLIGGRKTWGTESCWQEKADDAAEKLRAVMLELRARDDGRRDNAEILERVRAYYRDSLKS